MKSIRTGILFTLVLLYIVMTGGGTYEHLNVTTKVLRAPPESLAILHGPYAFNPIKFWAIFRPITILLFIASLAISWRAPYRNLLLASFVIDCLITLSTFLYFAPKTAILLKPNPSADILTRMNLWKNLNWIRLLAFYATSVLLLATFYRRAGK
ncbi:MAG: hypothetical protein KF775_04515 [Cyclobacteriaceae bacterium]|nr:hypothetical protein [Cyclobacteriaceae bacterium]